MSFQLQACSALAIALLVTGCGGSTPHASADGIAPSLTEDRLITLTELDQRVGRVAARLMDANAALCPTQRFSSGWMFHAANQYGDELRPLAERRFGLRGDLPGVLSAPPGSPAALAGFQVGDLLLAVNNVRLSEGRLGQAAQFEGIEGNVRLIDRALAEGAATFTVLRSGAERQITVTPRVACGYEVQVDSSDEMNARADGSRLFIGARLAMFAESDDELAFILGHELAHHVLGHRQFNSRRGEGRFSNPDWRQGHGNRGSREQQADRVGLLLAARAGYDAAVAPPFWRRFGAANWRVRYPQLNHASAEGRAAALEEVVEEIEAIQQRGGILLP